MNGEFVPESPNADEQLSALDELSREAGYDNLFPQNVRDLWQRGKGRKARKALLRVAKDQPDRRLRQLQMQHAGDFRLWLEPLRKAPPMTTLNGVGTRLYGGYQKESDGSYIGTLWFVFVFIPIWPLASYLVASAEGGGWHFFARAPRPPAAQMMQRLVVAAMVAIAGLSALAVYDATTHTDVLAYNGFDRPVTVRVGDATQVVPALGDWRFVDVEAKATQVGAAFEDSDEFESIDVDLAQHASDLVIYNVGSRGLLSVGYIVYGPGQPKDGRWLDAGPVIFLREEIDYVFRKPPESKQVAEGSSIRNSVLEAVSADVDPLQVMNALLGDGLTEQAQKLGLAELRVHPENAALALVTAQTTMTDVEAQRALLRDCIARAPGEVDLHRYYQELWPDGDAALVEEYRQRVGSEPGSAMNQYLFGRVVDDEDSLAYYRRALDLDPEYGPAHRALGYHWGQRGDYRQALAHYDRFAAFGAGEAREVLDLRLRLHRLLGASGSEQSGLLAVAADQFEQDFHVASLERHVRLESGGGQLDVLLGELDELGQAWWEIEPGSDQLAAARADLAITAGDLDRARSELIAFQRTGDRAHQVEWRLALSDGAADSDRARLLDEAGDWRQSLGEPQQLTVLDLLGDAERQELIAGFGNVAVRQAGELLDDAEALRKPSRLDTALADLHLPDRAMVYLAAARRLASGTDGAARRAREQYLRQAREHSLPGELPYAP